MKQPWVLLLLPAIGYYAWWRYDQRDPRPPAPTPAQVQQGRAETQATIEQAQRRR